MSYPNVKPSQRSYEHGDWPVKKFQALDGAEVRILYGSRRTSSKFKLQYGNISDAVAEEFLNHYNQMLGSFTTFQLPPQVLAGWTGALSPFDPEDDLRFRYDGPPNLDSVKPGVSNVSVQLIGVLA